MITKKLIIFTDSGDTIVDETTQVYDDRGIVLRADLIPGAGEVLRTLSDEGYRICMVADGEVESFHNVYKENGLGSLFVTRTISESVGLQKPNREMFDDAMRQNRLTDADKSRIIMIGNNCPKDIAGANRYGIRSVLIDWSKRYRTEPACEDEIPTYTVHEPSELLPLIERLESELEG